MSSGRRRYLASYHDCVPRNGVPDGKQLPLKLSDGGTVQVVVGNVGNEDASVVVATDLDVAAPAVLLNGARPIGAAQRIAGAVRYGHTPKAVWRIPFVRGAVRKGRNAIVIEPCAVAAKLVWCEVEVGEKIF